ncbi:type II secretion system F family protein [Streptomyces sp. NPDC051664]|uniref:type II secretion system F family protein n=1 Tax=Streptomyces sp. NPDC051664 TaxID=3365668 RepID=UPI0037AA9DDD
MGALAGAVASWRGQSAPMSRTADRGRGRRLLEELPAPWRDNYRHLVVVAAVAAVVVWVLTGRPVHGLIAFGGIAGLPFLLYPGGSARVEIEQLEAFADWLQQLSSVVGAGKPLEQAIHGTLSTVPELLRPSLAALAVRMSNGMPTAEAFRLFADDLDSQAGDDVVQLFLMHTETRGPNLARVVKQMALNVSQKAKNLRAIDADRARSRRKARNVTVFTLAVVVLGMTSSGYTAWYRTGPGQIGLFVVSMGIVGSLIWLRKTAQMKPEPRLLRTAAQRTNKEA